MTDMPEFYDETQRRARKPHKCIECAGDIPAGRLYMRINGKWSGEVQTLRMHLTCFQIVQQQRDHIKQIAGPYSDDLPAIGELVETAAEDAREGDDFPPYWPAGVYLSKAALRRYVDQVEA